MAKEIVVAERDKRAYEKFHFPSAVKHGDLILCSGRVGVAKGGVPDSAEEEFRNAWTIVGAVLEEAGADFGDIVEFTSYHVGMQEHLCSCPRCGAPRCRARNMGGHDAR